MKVPKLLPNVLSWSRVALAPVIAALHFLPSPGPLLALLIYIIAALTDYADGKIAREYHLSDRFGAFLDPVTDKILVIVVLMVLIASPDLNVNQNLLIALAGIVILREVIQSALRDWMAQSGRRDEVGVTSMSKFKTILQMVALGFLLAQATEPLEDWRWVGPVGAALLALAAAMSVYTLGQFLLIAFRNPPGGGDGEEAK